MVYKHTYLNTLLLLHFVFMLSVVKMMLKGEVGGRALNSHGNYIVDLGKSWKNQGIVFLNFCGNPVNSVLSKRTILHLWSISYLFLFSKKKKIGLEPHKKFSN